MNRRRRRRFLTGLFAAMLSAVLLWSASVLILASEKPKRITVVYTNDTLGTLEPCG